MIRKHPERRGAFMIKKRHALLLVVVLVLVGIGGAACSALGGAVVSAVDATLTVIAAQTINAGPNAEGTDEPASANLPEAPDGITFRIIETSPDGQLYLIEILWRDLSDNESGFIVLRTFTNSGRAPTEVVRVGADTTAAEDGRAACGRDYLYYVSAFNSSGISEGTCRTLKTPACGSGGTTLVVGECDALPGVARAQSGSGGGTNGQGAGLTPTGASGANAGAGGSNSGASTGNGSTAQGSGQSTSGSSSCGDGICSADEQSGDGYCGIDCGAGGGGAPGACGNGTCDVGQGENTHSCPDDCTGFPGDGYCDSGETEINSPDCTLILGYCGDGICEAGETCVDDCGIQTEFCGDGQCTGSENAFNCANDCGTGPQGGGFVGPGCGNGQLDPGEACEEHSDCQEGFTCGDDCGCHAVATEGYCGDGVIQWYEECEVAVTGPWCSASERCWACNCEYVPSAACNNGTIDPGEACDGAAAVNGGCPTNYSCSIDCTYCAYNNETVCGDGIITGWETCESDSDCSQGYTCSGCNCQFNSDLSVCGNGVVEEGESCESNSDCSPNFSCGSCQCFYDPPYECGNGIVEPGEQCDSSSSTCGTNEFCTADCLCTP